MVATASLIALRVLPFAMSDALLSDPCSNARQHGQTSAAGRYFRIELRGFIPISPAGRVCNRPFCNGACSYRGIVMKTFQTTAIVSTRLFALLGTSSSAFAQTDLKDRVATAVEAVEKSCGNDINALCGKVTRGEGRLLLCMQAHEDRPHSPEFGTLSCHRGAAD